MFKKLFYNPMVGAIADWATVLSVIAFVLTFIFAWLVTLIPEWFGTLTWPQTILIALGLSVGLLFLVAVSSTLCAFAYRLIKPLPVPTSRPLPVPRPVAPEREASDAVEVKLPKPDIAPSETKPLHEQERGPCLLALQQIHDFIMKEVAELHHALLTSGNAPGKDQPLFRTLPALLNTQAKLSIRAGRLGREHALALQRMGIDIRGLKKVIQNIEVPAKGFYEARDWPCLLYTSDAADE